MIARTYKVSSGARRLAVLNTDIGQLAQAAFIDLHIDHQPGLVKTQILERHVKQAAHRTRGAVAANDIAGAYLERLGYSTSRATVSTTIITAQAQTHARGILLQPYQFGAKRQLHAVVRCGGAAHDFLHRGLREHHVGRPAKRIRRWHRAKALDQPPVHAVVLGRGEGRGMGQHLVDDAQVLEHAHDFVIKRKGTRLVIHAARAIDYQRAHAHAAKQTGAGRAGRAKAHHHHIKAFGHRVQVLQGAPGR